MWRTRCGLYKSILVGNYFLFCGKVSFFDNLVGKLDSSWSSQKINKFSFPYLSLKLSLTLPHQGKMLWCSNFRFFIKLINLDRCGNLIEKFNFVSTPWKITIPIANHHQTHHHSQSLHTPPTQPLLAHHPPLHPPSKPQPTLPLHPYLSTHPPHHHPLNNPTPPPPPPHHHPLHNPTPPPPTPQIPTHPKNPQTTHPWRKSGALMPGSPCSSPCVLPTCSSWALITFRILTHHVQIFSNPGRFQNLPAHHPHHNPPSSPPSPMPPPILPPPPTTSLISTPCTPNPTHYTTYTPPPATHPHTPSPPTTTLTPPPHHGEKVGP